LALGTLVREKKFQLNAAFDDVNIIVFPRSYIEAANSLATHGVHLRDDMY
jgi:hypothetical protein